MVEPTGIVGVAAKLIKTITQLGLDWKDAPAEAKRFIHELQSLETLLYQTFTHVVSIKDLLTRFMVAYPIPRFSARSGLKEAWVEQQQNHHAQSRVLNEIQVHVSNQSARREHEAILNWHTPIAYMPQFSDFLLHRQPGTGQWLLDSEEFNSYVPNNIKQFEGFSALEIRANMEDIERYLRGHMDELRPCAKRELAAGDRCWIVGASDGMPLRTVELQHALAVEPDKDKFDEDNLPEIEDINSPESDVKDVWGRTPLTDAASQGHIVVMRMLLDTGWVAVNATDIWDRTPLSYAAEYGHLAVVHALLATGNLDARSALECAAARGGHLPVVEALFA
ncbi:hypothetical protein VTI74DRAFT_7229 [Chaetomium olivicolor]